MVRRDGLTDWLVMECDACRAFGVALTPPTGRTRRVIAWNGAQSAVIDNPRSDAAIALGLVGIL